MTKRENYSCRIISLFVTFQSQDKADTDRQTDGQTDFLNYVYLTRKNKAQTDKLLKLRNEEEQSTDRQTDRQTCKLPNEEIGSPALITRHHEENKKNR